MAETNKETIEEKTTADPEVVKKYKAAGDIVNSKLKPFKYFNEIPKQPRGLPSVICMCYHLEFYYIEHAFCVCYQLKNKIL